MVGVRLGVLEPREDAAAHRRPSCPSPTRLGRGGDAHGVDQVLRAVPSEVAGGAHRAGEHDRLLRRHRARDQVRGLLERVGAVRQHDAVDVGLGEQLEQPRAQRPLPLDGHVRPRDSAPTARRARRPPPRCPRAAPRISSAESDGTAPPSRSSCAHRDRAAGEQRRRSSRPGHPHRTLPPFTFRISPVTCRASGEQRKTIGPGDVLGASRRGRSGSSRAIRSRPPPRIAPSRHLGVDPARRDAVHRDAARRQLHGQRLHERDHRALAGGVVGVHRLAALARGARHHHDAAAVAQRTRRGARACRTSSRRSRPSCARQRCVVHVADRRPPPPARRRR